jgi:hypothetical protein
VWSLAKLAHELAQCGQPQVGCFAGEFIGCVSVRVSVRAVEETGRAGSHFNRLIPVPAGVAVCFQLLWYALFFATVRQDVLVHSMTKRVSFAL